MANRFAALFIFCQFMLLSGCVDSYKKEICSMDNYVDIDELDSEFVYYKNENIKDKADVSIIRQDFGLYKVTIDNMLVFNANACRINGTNYLEFFDPVKKRDPKNPVVYIYKVVALKDALVLTSLNFDIDKLNLSNISYTKTFPRIISVDNKNMSAQELVDLVDVKNSEDKELVLHALK